MGGSSDPNGLRLEGIGIFYIVLAIVHTCGIITALFFLYTWRRSAAVRMRSFPIIVSTVVILHLYFVGVSIAWPLNDLIKCGAEYWIMNSVFPLGVALFQGQWFAYIK